MSQITMKELLEAGVHFGHQTKRWNPKMKKYIFGKRNGIYIIDLQKTLKCFREAAAFITDVASQGKNILFVGTKRQAQDAIYEEANRCGMFYVNNRWLGGTLTNFVTIRKSISRLKEIEAILVEGSDAILTKKERIHLDREKAKLAKNLVGIKEMEELPDVLFVIDPKKEAIAVQEGQEARDPGRRDRRHELRSRRHHARDSGQRRRDPRHQALHGQDGRRRSRGPARPGRAVRRQGRARGRRADAHELPGHRTRTPPSPRRLSFRSRSDHFSEMTAGGGQRSPAGFLT